MSARRKAGGNPTEADRVSARAVVHVVYDELRRRDVSLSEFTEWCAHDLGGTRQSHARTLYRMAHESRWTHFGQADRYLTVAGRHLWELDLVSNPAAPLPALPTLEAVAA